MKQRVSLACALVHEPPLMLLDEPTAGVDPLLRRRMWGTFGELRARGATVIVSTNQLDEILHRDRLVFLRDGRLLAEDAPASLLDRGKARVTIVRGGHVETFELRDYERELPRLVCSPEVESAYESNGTASRTWCYGSWRTRSGEAGARLGDRAAGATPDPARPTLHRALAVIPCAIVVLLKLVLDGWPTLDRIGVDAGENAVPAGAFIVHFVAYLLAAIALVRERTEGTLDRMLVATFRRAEIVLGYVAGFAGLAFVQAGIVLATIALLYDAPRLGARLPVVLLVVFLLAVASISLGLLVSSTARWRVRSSR